MARQLPSLVLLFVVFVALSNAADWCSITCRDWRSGGLQEHVMCTYRNDRPARRCNQVEKRDLEQSEINFILQHHNDVRRSADNLPPLVWDEELATVAQRWANQCNFGHDKCRDLIVNHPVGQNSAVYWDSRGKTDLQRLLGQWSNEKRNVNRNIIASYPYDDAMQSRVGHYTQIVWRETTKVGCGFISYRGPTNVLGSIIQENYYVYYLVCNYDVGGNLPGARVY